MRRDQTFNPNMEWNMQRFWVISFKKSKVEPVEPVHPVHTLAVKLRVPTTSWILMANSQKLSFLNLKMKSILTFFYVLKTYFEVQLFKPYKRWRRRRWYGKQGIERCAKLPNLRLSHNSTHLALTHCSFLSSCHAIHTVTKFQKPSLVFRYFKGQKCFCQWSMRIFRQNKWLKMAGRIFVR